MNFREQATLAFRRQFGGKDEFVSYFRALTPWAVLGIALGNWVGVLGGVVGIAIVFVIFFVKEPGIQKELRRRRALPPTAIRGASN